MNFFSMLQEWAKQGMPLRVGLIGVGKVGAMFLSQALHTPGLHVLAISDLDVARTREELSTVGWPSERYGAASPAKALSLGSMYITDDVDELINADALAGPLLALRAAEANVVYSLAYGDQPALIAKQLVWARACGFQVISLGKGTTYLPHYNASTPETVWDHFGLTSREATLAGMNAKMFNLFLYGTQSAIEMAAVANT
jgi:predicted homoserine dehydrogenase-like protein